MVEYLVALINLNMQLCPNVYFSTKNKIHIKLERVHNNKVCMVLDMQEQTDTFLIRKHFILRFLAILGNKHFNLIRLKRVLVSCKFTLYFYKLMHDSFSTIKHWLSRLLTDNS